MKACNFCNNLIPDEAKICSKCGAKVKENGSDMLLKNQEEEQDVLSLGNPEIFPEEKNKIIKINQQNTKVPYLALTKIKSFYKKLSKKSKIIISAAMALIITAGAALPFAMQKKEEIPVPVFEEIELPNISLYIKNDCLYAASLKEGKTKKVISGLQQNNLKLDNPINVKNNGTRLFYTIQSDASVDAQRREDLYYTDLDFSSDKECNSILVETDIGYYASSDDGKKIVYIKRADKRLYCGSLGSTEQIDKNVDYCLFDDELSFIFYKKGNNNLFVYTKDKGAINIANNTTKAMFFPEPKIVYYISDTNLYKYSEGKKALIDSNISEIASTNDKGELHYTKIYSTNLNYYDIVDDDKKASDSALVYPAEPTEPVRSDFKNSDDYVAAFKEYENEYNNVYLTKKKEYEEKLSRDVIRQVIVSEVYTYQKCSLYYYNNESIVKISENAKITNSFSDYILFSEIEADTPPKKSIASFSSVLDVQNYIESYLKGTPKSRISYESQTVDFPQDLKFINNTQSPSGNVLYFWGDVEESDLTSDPIGNLYKAEISGGELGNLQKIDSEIYMGIKFTNKSGKIVCIKKTKDNKKSLYVGSEQVDNSGKYYTFYAIPESDSIIWTSQNQTNNTLKDIKLYDGSTTVTIAEKSTLVNTFKSDCITYLKYNEKSQLFDDLYLFDGSNEPKLLESSIQNVFVRYSLSGMYVRIN